MYAANHADYSAWINQYEGTVRHGITEPGVGWKPKAVDPIVTFILQDPIDARALEITAASLQAQTYLRWHLVIAVGQDGASGPFIPFPHDARVKRATLSSLSDLDGDFFVFCRNGDHFPAQALLKVVETVRSTAGMDILYTDDDELDLNGNRVAPRFKTGWDPDLLLGENYLDGLTLYGRELLACLGDGTPGMDPYRIALEATALVQPNRIHHIPEVLCHRLRARSAHSPDRSRSAREFVQQYLADRSPGALIEAAPLAPGKNWVRWPVPHPAPLVTVIVPTRDRASLLRRCAEGLLKGTDYPAIEFLVVDNGSADADALALLEELARDDRVRTLRFPGAFNYSAMNNLAAGEARGDVLLLLNNDIEVLDPGWLREMVGQALRPDVGAVGAKLLYPDGRLQHGGVVFGPGPIARHILQTTQGDDPGWNNQLALARSLSAVTGACMAVRREVMQEAGGFDEVHLQVAYNDVDLCFRIADLGYRVVWTPFAVLVHHESATRGEASMREEIDREERELGWIWRRWRREMDEDPFHNPNLQLHTTTQALLAPPRHRIPPWRRM